MNGESNITVQPGKESLPVPVFTAAQIAAVLGIKRQSAQWYLRDVSPAVRLRQLESFPAQIRPLASFDWIINIKLNAK
jgi:hypothetical protein